MMCPGSSKQELAMRRESFLVQLPPWSSVTFETTNPRPATPAVVDEMGQLMLDQRNYGLPVGPPRLCCVLDPKEHCGPSTERGSPACPATDADMNHEGNREVETQLVSTSTDRDRNRASEGASDLPHLGKPVLEGRENPGPSYLSPVDTLPLVVSDLLSRKLRPRSKVVTPPGLDSLILPQELAARPEPLEGGEGVENLVPRHALYSLRKTGGKHLKSGTISTHPEIFR